MLTPTYFSWVGVIFKGGGASSISARAITTKRTTEVVLFVVAVWTRLELATPCVTGRYSNQLNYHTVLVFFQRDKGKNIF